MTSTNPIGNSNTEPNNTDNQDTLHKTAGEITSTWKNGSYRQDQCLIKDTIVGIYNNLPSDTKYDAVRSSLRKELDSLWYTAPEILGKVWVNVYNLLEHQIPPPSNTNPVWLQNIERTWNEGNIKYRDLCKTG